jgi:UDP-N-acetylglucosamine acyltransferase
MTENTIESTAIIIGDVSFGKGNYIGHHSILVGPLVIGNNNHISNSVTIGTIGEDDIYSPEEHDPRRVRENVIKIGDRNIFREYMTVHRGLVSSTSIGDDNYFMSRSHISHDSVVENHVKIADNVTMGGFTTLQDGSYLGLGAVLHQFSVIGSGCMLGMNSTVTKPIRPGSVAVGQPARVIKSNEIGLGKLGISDVSWWNLDISSYPDKYIQLLTKFQLECERREQQKNVIREWRSSFLQNKTLNF